MTRDIEVQAFGSHLERLLSAINGDHGDILQKVDPIVRAGISDNFTRGGSPEGAWPRRKHHGHPTRDRGRSGYPGHPLLIDLGGLFLAATQDGGGGHVRRIANNELETGIEGGSGDDDPFVRGMAHNFGTSSLPRREFMVLGDDRIEQIDALILDMIDRKIEAV